MDKRSRHSNTSHRRPMFLFLMITGFLICNIAFSQDCLSTINLTLKDINTGGVHIGQTVTLTSKADGQAYKNVSNTNGEVVFKVPCGVMYEIGISNYTKKKEMLSPASATGTAGRTLTYPADMVETQKHFDMTPQEMLAVDATANAFPDTTVLKIAVMSEPAPPDHFRRTTLELKMVDGQPLGGEAVSFIGEKRHKNIKGITDRTGKIVVYLPKGDRYSINFKYDKGYAKADCDYSKGTGKSEIQLSYLGTKEIERRKAEEAIRIAAEEKRLKAEKERFAAECKKLGISVEEGYKRKAESYASSYSNFNDTVIRAVLNRNKWSEKLIVCDLTGSMLPYASQLSAWYQLNYAKEKNLQFVFFNDGDNKTDREKQIGNTGGIYYEPAQGMDKLTAMIGRVGAAGDGGDCPENNMEALIKGVKMANPYKELVMIVDNDAPVKDIALLNQFKAPVHIILCGVQDGDILTDYLDIARHTKGSVHTIEEDIAKIASLSEGQEIVIKNKTYRVMGGKFVQINKS